MQETQAQSLGWEDPLEKGIESTLVLLPIGFHRQRRAAPLASIKQMSRQVWRD